MLDERRLRCRIGRRSPAVNPPSAPVRVAEAACPSPVDHAVCALADGLPAYRRRPHGSVQLALCSQDTAARCCCASRTRTGSGPPRRRSTPFMDGMSTGWVCSWDGDDRPISSQRDRTPSGGRRPSSLLEARATPTLCYTSSAGTRAEMREAGAAREGGHPATTGAGATGTGSRRARRRQAGDPPCGSRRRREGLHDAPRQGAGTPSPGPTKTSRTSSCCGRTEPPPTCSPWWSTITTWASPRSSAATTTSPTRPSQMHIYEALGWPRARDGPYPDDPRGGRRQAVQAPRRARGRRLPVAWAICRLRLRNYLVRLGWSQGDQRDVLDRGDDRRPSTSDPGRPLALALRLRQARPTSTGIICAHMPDDGAARCAVPRDPAATCPRAAGRCSRQDRPRACGTKLLRRSCRASKNGPRRWSTCSTAPMFLFADRPLALDAKAAEILEQRRTGSIFRHLLPRLRGRLDILDRRQLLEGVVRGLCRGDRRQARPGRPAAACRADRTDHLARDLRRVGGSGPGGEPGPAARIAMGGVIKSRPAA